MSELAQRGQAEAAKKKRCVALDAQTLVAAVHEVYRVLGVLGDEKARSPYKHVRLVIDSISAFWADKPAMARKYSYDLKTATHRENVTAYLVSQYAMTTRSMFSFGLGHNVTAYLVSQYAMTTRSMFSFGLGHIADGVFHLWMDNVESRREVVRYLVIKEMGMTNRRRTAFKLGIVPGKGIVISEPSWGYLQKPRMLTGVGEAALLGSSCPLSSLARALLRGSASSATVTATAASADHLPHISTQYSSTSFSSIE
ncbi:ATPase domain-containing protein [Thermogladius sp.]|uniref:ATPase domain-containing protein n=1 Tax=Thermogladius sp. TaxID=2023064 RepID=UPI003D0F58E8